MKINVDFEVINSHGSVEIDDQKPLIFGTSELFTGMTEAEIKEFTSKDKNDWLCSKCGRIYERAELKDPTKVDWCGCFTVIPTKDGGFIAH